MEEPMELYRRLHKTLYYDNNNAKSMLDASSLPLTEVTVSLIEKTISYDSDCLGKLDVNYAAHVLHQACISPASIMVAMIYLERLKRSNSEYLLQISSSELFLISLVVASKFLFDNGDDELVYNDEWAEFANVDLDELNRIEREFLTALNWSCYVDENCFMKQLIRFEALVSRNEYLKRPNSHLTYTELVSLFNYMHHRYMKDLNYLSQAFHLLKSILLITLTYCTAVALVTVSCSVIFSLHHTLHSNKVDHFGSSDNFTLQHSSPLVTELRFTWHHFEANRNKSQIVHKHNQTVHSLNQISHLFTQKHSKFLKCI